MSEENQVSETAPEQEVRVVQVPVLHQVLREKTAVAFDGTEKQVYEKIAKWMETNAWRIPEGSQINVCLDVEVVQPLCTGIQPTPHPYLNFDI